jgi:hypothetical protein
MRRYYRFALLVVLVGATLACGLITNPINNVKNTAETAQALVTSLPSLEALPSAFPSLEALSSAFPTVENLFNPTGEPVAEWNGIPIMSEATAGSESSSSQYSFKAPVSVDAVQNFYADELGKLGWSQVMSLLGSSLYTKDNQTLSITATDQGGGEVLVFMILQ